VEALRLLRAQGKNVLVLATGNTEDHRQPGYFAALMRQVAEAGVQDCFRVLGVVPYQDLMGLMAASVAVLNPSLSEGWSTTVEEAKSFGKRVLLSDIAVHREQAPERAVYIDPQDASELASHLAQTLSDDDPAVEQRQMHSVLARLPERRCKFAKRFEEIVLDLVRPLG
jgi:glycosyltransferase involved in cell wall biosynthesis